MADAVPIAEASDGDLAVRIVRGAGAGARAAEAELCRRFAPRVVSYGLRHLRDAAAADDLAQRVLMLTLEKLRGGNVREPDRIASFILGSARLTAQAMRRGQARCEPVASDHPALATRVAPAPEIVDREQVAACLERLSERERTIIVLSFFQEASGPEIGRMLGIDDGNVRVIRHRALRRLRECLVPATEEP